MAGTSPLTLTSLSLVASVFLNHACTSNSSCGTDGSSATTHNSTGEDGTGGVENFGSGGNDGETTTDIGGMNSTGNDDGDIEFSEAPPAGRSDYNCQPPEGAVPALKLTEIAADLDEPVQVLHAPDDARLFIVQRDGRIMLYQDGAVAEEPFLNLADLVASNDDTDFGENGDRALGGMAFHPDYAENGAFYVYYNTLERDGYAHGDAILAEFQVSSDPNLAELESEQVLLHIARDSHIDHHGGGLAFGGDHMLYLGLGDGNSWPGAPGEGEQQADPDGNAQNPSALLGSLLRIDPSPGTGTYTAPAGNLSATDPLAAPEVWDKGLRNPFRIDFDGCTGTLYIADVGFNQQEEIDVEIPGDGSRNYGWPIMEGSACTESGCSPSEDFTDPAYSYPFGSTRATVIGGAVYRGSAVPGLRGKYLFADHLKNAVYYLTFDEQTKTVSGVTDISEDLDYPSGPTSIATGHDGEIYLTSYFDNKLFRLDPE